MATNMLNNMTKMMTKNMQTVVREYKRLKNEEFEIQVAAARCGKETKRSDC